MYGPTVVMTTLRRLGQRAQRRRVRGRRRRSSARRPRSSRSASSSLRRVRPAIAQRVSASACSAQVLRGQRAGEPGRAEDDDVVFAVWHRAIMTGTVRTAMDAEVTLRVNGTRAHGDRGHAHDRARPAARAPAPDRAPRRAATTASAAPARSCSTAAGRTRACCSPSPATAPRSRRSRAWTAPAAGGVRRSRRASSAATARRGSCARPSGCSRRPTGRSTTRSASA